MTLDHIGHNIYVGDIVDAAGFDGIICCVLEHDPDEDVEGGVLVGGVKINDRAIRFPILNAMVTEVDIIQLERLARFVQRARKAQPRRKILIHCYAGQERSPLAAAWVLWTIAGKPSGKFKDYYHIVKDNHSDTQYRYEWLPVWLKEGIM